MMKTQSENIESRHQGHFSEQESGEMTGGKLPFADNRPETLQRRNLQAAANASPQVRQLQQISTFANAEQQPLQRAAPAFAQAQPIQRMGNTTPLSRSDFEAYLNKTAGPNGWCYVGGFACNVWFEKYGMSLEECSDIDLAVRADVRDQVNDELREMTGCAAEESPVVDGLKVTIFSGDEEHGMVVGTASAMKPETIIARYQPALLKAEIAKFGKAELSEEEMQKQDKRKRRVEQLKEVVKLM